MQKMEFKFKVNKDRILVLGFSSNVITNLCKENKSKNKKLNKEKSEYKSTKRL